MNESFDIVPGSAVGPFRLGMSRAETQSLHSCPITSFYKTPDSQQRTDDFTILGVHVHYDANDCADYIEAHIPVQYNDVKHHLDGNLVTGLTVGQLREICGLLGQPLVGHAAITFVLWQRALAQFAFSKSTASFKAVT